ncbi:serine/threonine-protein kinase [Kitasatospora sp. NPDC088346]|uniref:serine/threonine-protein kinase n=1 Tax=Kitasatospora sp. NPDC088346 TaxID=3364073 RepID=UPI0038178FAF
METLGGEDPRQIGEYRLLRRLGAGGMGQVFLGRTAGGRTVAVKTVHREYAADHEFRVRFRQEVNAARRVGGRWTAPVLDADTEGDQPWVATGYIPGPSLHAAVAESGPLPGSAVRVLGAGLVEALAAVHGLGLVHRDVKPSNVLLALDGPRLIDFGIARSLDAATALTRSGFVIGSPGYLSPEQAQGLAAGPPSDVFSLGAVLAFAAGGAAPFGAGTSAPVLLYRVVHEAPDLGRLDSLDAGLRKLIQACLAKEPGDRPTPGQLRDALAAGADGGAVRAGGDWLPPAVAGSLARLAVELLDLDGEDGAPAPGPGAAPPVGAPAGRFGPPAPWSAAPPPTMTAAPSPGPPPAEPTSPTTAPARGPRRGLLVGAALAVVAVAGLTAWLVNAWGSADSGGTGAGAGPTSRSSAPAAAPVGEPASGGPATAGASGGASQQPSGLVPAGYLGTWSGTLGAPAFLGKADFRITIGQGAKGDPVGSIHNNTGPGTAYCDSLALLVSADSGRLVLKTAPTTGLSGCVAIPSAQVYTRNADGSLHLEVDGLTGNLAGEH